MYESSCSYQTALDLKRTSPLSQVKSEDCFGITQCSPDWASYRFHQSTFEQLKQSVEKAKAALQDRTGFLGTSAFRWVVFFKNYNNIFRQNTIYKAPLGNPSNKTVFFLCSDIYTTPRLAESLENITTIGNGSGGGGGGSGNVGLNTSICGTVNGNSISQRHRIDSLAATASTTSLSQSLDVGGNTNNNNNNNSNSNTNNNNNNSVGGLDTKHRQGKIIRMHTWKSPFFFSHH